MKDQHATELAEAVGPGTCLGSCARKKAIDSKRVSLFSACTPSFPEKKIRGDRVEGLMSVTGCYASCRATTRMESLPKLRGTRAWIVVPRLSWELTEKLP